LKVVVIGAGLSGLTSAAFMAKAGHDVAVYEQNGFIGGVASLISKNGYSWEQGPLLLGDMLPGESVYQLLKRLGITLQVWQEERGIVLPDYDMWHPDDYQGPYWRKDRLKSLFPDESEGIDAYYDFYDNMTALMRIALEKPSIAQKVRLIRTFSKVKKYKDMNAQELMDTFFKSPKIKALFTGILADVCVKPSEFMALGVPMFNIETAFEKRIPLCENGKKIRNGYVYVKGSVNKIATELARVIEAFNGKIYTNETVTKINVGPNGVTGVNLSGNKTAEADIIIASGGANEVFRDLLGENHLDNEYKNILSAFKPMDSVFMVHLGVDTNPLEYQKTALCYYYGSYDIEGAIDRIRNGIYHEGKDGFLIYVPSIANPEMAPDGHYAVTIYTVAPDTLKTGIWETLKNEYADKLIGLASERIPSLKDHINEKVIVTPIDFRRLTHLHKSAFGGLVPLWGVKNPPHKTPVKNLYFVGQQSENMGGVGAVMLGAEITANLALKENRKERRK